MREWTRYSAFAMVTVAVVVGVLLAGCSRTSGVAPDQAAAVRAKKRDPNK